MRLTINLQQRGHLGLVHTSAAAATFSIVLHAAAAQKQ